MKTRFALFLLFLATSVAGFADTFVLTGTGDVQGTVAVVPYFLSINGSSPATETMCDSYFNDVFLGQTWSGTVNTWATLADTKFGASFGQQYLKAGWLFDQYRDHNDQAGDINFAEWALFVPDLAAFKLIPGWTSGAQAWLDAANATDPAILSDVMNRLLIFTPDDTSDKGPQEYIATVPEAGSLSLVVTGLLAAGAFRRKYFAQSAS